MRNAPSVVYPVGRCRFYAGLLIFLGLLSLVVLLYWTWPWVSPGVDPLSASDRWAGPVGAVLWLGWGGFAVFSWRRSPIGALQWDALGSQATGEAATGVWRWRSAAYRDGTPLQQVRLALDLQSRMLLCLRNTDAAQTWVWVEQGSDPPRWFDLRRALVATRA